ncbi:MAG: gliding motility-associated C-terminal domain-containing protein [Bacteroidota bacterium]
MLRLQQFFRKKKHHRNKKEVQSMKIPKSGRLFALRIVALLAGLLLLPTAWESLYATHNLAGQITARHLGGNRYEVTITTYTDPAPAGVDRCAADLEILSASGVQIEVIARIPRNNGPADPTPDPDECPSGVRLGQVIFQTVKRNIYQTVYDFPGPGKYILRYYDVARREDVKNISNPGGQAFFVETELQIPVPLAGINNTPVLLNEPLEQACTDKIYTHNPGGFDPDGDSLVYSLLPSLQYEPPKGITNPIPTTNYRFPDDAAFGTSTFTIDSRTGLITWDAPRQIGVYNVAYRVEEYREGVLLGSVIRDLAIFVEPCDNNPPVIETISDTCVAAGDTLRFDFLAYDPDGGTPDDPDGGDSLYFLLTNGNQGPNGPFRPDLSNPATVGGQIVDVDFPLQNRNWATLPESLKNTRQVVDTIKGTVTWATECENIRASFYQVDFQAHDNLSYIEAARITMLTANKIVTIQVIPPKPTGLTAVKSPGQISLSWDQHSCPNVVGYRVYRKVGPEGFNQDTICCDQSPRSLGYQLLQYNPGGTNTSYVDDLSDLDEVIDQQICYVVTAMFGSEFDPNVESCGIEACVEIENDKLFMTNDSVSVTDPVNGEIFLAWSKPDSIDDFFVGPFTYNLYRANNNQFPLVEVISGLGLDDTTYLDQNLNTEIRGYNYRVEVVDIEGRVVATNEGINQGSSIFLTTQGGNGYIDLDWSEFVPWSNSQYEIFRSDGGGAFQLVNTLAGTGANFHTYRDTGLNLQTEYCYFVRSTGSHNEQNVKDPLINDSQVSCDFARDDEPPCAPLILVDGDCITKSHQIVITKSDLPCADDTRSIQILYAPLNDGNYQQVQQILYGDFSSDTTITYETGFDITEFAGCYVITATDSFDNTSSLTDPFCIDYCPALELGNIFTPNNDGINDVFRPIVFQDVVLRQFSIFDRWGKLMSENTAEISRLWDGRDDRNNQDAAEGVYYYYIRWEELSINGSRTREKKGWVTLLR